MEDRVDASTPHRALTARNADFVFTIAAYSVTPGQSEGLSHQVRLETEAVRQKRLSYVGFHLALAANGKAASPRWQPANDA